MSADDAAVSATQAIANVVKSSFGPSGLDKMMVDDIGVCYFLESRRVLLSDLGRYGNERRRDYTELVGRRASGREDIG